MSILAKTFEEFQFWLKFSEILDFGQNLPKMSILDKVTENVEYSQNFWKISIFSIIIKISISVKIDEKYWFVKIFGKSRFGLNLPKYRF